MGFCEVPFQEEVEFGDGGFLSVAVVLHYDFPVLLLEYKGSIAVVARIVVVAVAAEHRLLSI